MEVNNTMTIANDSKGTKIVNAIARLKKESHFGIVKGIENAFKPNSVLVLGSSIKTVSYLHKNIDRFMSVDFEQDRFDKNVSHLNGKAEFYPKVFPVYDDSVITGKESLELNELYGRIKNFFKQTDLLVIDQAPKIALGALSFFADSSEIIILKGVHPSKVKNENFVKYKLDMRYVETSTVLIQKHLPVGYNAIRGIVYENVKKFYIELGIKPSFRFFPE